MYALLVLLTLITVRIVLPVALLLVLGTFFQAQVAADPKGL